MYKVIHLIGAQKTNYPWGFENRIIPALEAHGCQVISTDYRQEHEELLERFHLPSDLILVCKGDGISPDIIRSVEVPVVLWWPELLGSMVQVDALAMQKRQLLNYNVAAYDFVFVHDEASVPVCRAMGAHKSAFLPTASVDPAIHRKVETEKKYDIGFVGQMTPKRSWILGTLQNDFQVEVRQVWDPKELNLFINQCRIFLNIHSSQILNTETRLCEVLGAGTFLLSEQISSPNLFRDGKHLAYWKANDVEDLKQKLAFYLSHEEERERIARQGWQEANENHTVQKRVAKILEAKYEKRPDRDWPGELLGVLYDADGNETRRKEPFYQAVAMMSDG